MAENNVFTLLVCLSVCLFTRLLRKCQPIFMKFGGSVGHGPDMNGLHFESELHLYRGFLKFIQ